MEHGTQPMVRCANRRVRHAPVGRTPCVAHHFPEWFAARTLREPRIRRTHPIARFLAGMYRKYAEKPAFMTNVDCGFFAIFKRGHPHEQPLHVSRIAPATKSCSSIGNRVFPCRSLINRWLPWAVLCVLVADHGPGARGGRSPSDMRRRNRSKRPATGWSTRKWSARASRTRA